MRIHLIAIGGAIMHNLAIDLKNNGHTVSGSDDEIYEPSYSQLKKAGLLPDSWGWNAQKITTDIDVVIVGMHARKDNPELAKAKAINLPIYSFPEFVAQQATAKNKIVVAGSHGKTTTTAMLLHVLNKLKITTDYLVGSQISGFTTMVKLSDSDKMVLEGDEYLSSPLDLRPKFIWYQPQTAIITGIAWDHINVFPTFEEYKQAFVNFLKSMPEGGKVIWFESDSTLKEIMEAHGQHLKSHPYAGFTYATENNSVVYKGTHYPVQVFGDHNIQNMEAAAEAAKSYGVSTADFLTAIADFTGAGGRMEYWKNTKDHIVIRDFAHSPSKLKATIAAVRKKYPNHQLRSVYELHTYSSLQAQFMSHYQQSMEAADAAMVFYDPHVFEMKKLPFLNPTEVQKAFGSVTLGHKKLDLLDFLKEDNSDKKCWLLMSSGRFDNTTKEDIDF